MPDDTGGSTVPYDQAGGPNECDHAAGIPCHRCRTACDHGIAIDLWCSACDADLNEGDNYYDYEDEDWTDDGFGSSW